MRDIGQLPGPCSLRRPAHRHALHPAGLNAVTFALSALCGCSRFDFPDGSHGVLIAAGNIALIAPRLTQTQPDDEMQPGPHHQSRPYQSQSCPGSRAHPPCPSSSNRSRRNRLPMTSSRHNRAKRPPGLRCSMRLPNLPPQTSRPRPKPFRPRPNHRARATPCHRSVCRAGPQARRLPLRFTWQMDREGRFTLGTDEFTGLIGPRTTAAFGRPWREIAETFGFDPTGRMMQAFATGATWSGITLNWPVDGGGTLPVELSGLPIFDAARNFIGYRGFGVCRDFDAIARLAALRLAELSGEMVTPQEPSAAPSAEPTGVASPSSDELPEPIAAEISAAETSAAEPSHQKDLETPVEPPKEALEESVRARNVRKSQGKRPGNRQGRADGNRNRVAGRRCRKRLAVPRPGRREAASADAG